MGKSQSSREEEEEEEDVDDGVSLEEARDVSVVACGSEFCKISSLIA